MKRTSRVALIAALLAVAALATTLAMSRSGRDDAVVGQDRDLPDRDEPTATVAEGDARSQRADISGEVQALDADVGETDGESAASTGLTIRLYWIESGENAIGVERTLPYTEAAAAAAMSALLAGPTPQEQASWPAISSNIPAGTSLLGVTIANGVARVDLSEEFESGGGTFSVTSRLAQVVYTLDQFPTVDAVEFYINGARVEFFSSEGLILDGPQTSDDYTRLVPIDA